MKTAFTSGIVAPSTAEPALWFLFQGYRLLVSQEDNRAQVPTLRSPTDIGLQAIRQQYLGHLSTEHGQLHCYSGEISDGATPPTGFSFESLRPLYALLDEHSFWLAGRAVQIVDWDRTNQYCGRCGHATTDNTHDRSKSCPNCGLSSFPRLAPAVIVRVQKESISGTEILLARANRFPTAMYSVLAGFVEPGESLEECVEREIQEEVGITVKNIRYFGSQPWPFPHSLMVAFTADYDSGDLIPDPLEIADASWFAPDNLPGIPPPPSIANRLITTWMADNKPTGQANTSS